MLTSFSGMITRDLERDEVGPWGACRGLRVLHALPPAPPAASRSRSAPRARHEPRHSARGPGMGRGSKALTRCSVARVAALCLLLARPRLAAMLSLTRHGPAGV